MTFVNELIPEEQKSKFSFHIKTRPDGSKPTLYKWSIDREQNAYLVVTNVLGGGYEGTPPDYYFVLTWNGVQVSFAAEEHLSGSKEIGTVVSWKIHRLDIPSELEEHKNQVLQLIRDALNVRGWLYDRSRVSVVNVQFATFSN